MNELDELKTDLDTLNNEIRLLKEKVFRLERVVITQNVQIQKLTDNMAKLIALLMKSKGGESPR
jgi:hypothetical protein